MFTSSMNITHVVNDINFKYPSYIIKINYYFYWCTCCVRPLSPRLVKTIANRSGHLQFRSEELGSDGRTCSCEHDNELSGSISWLTEWLSASEEGLCSVQLAHTRIHLTECYDVTRNVSCDAKLRLKGYNELNCSRHNHRLIRRA